jgi:hypothetical protein
VIDAMGAVRSKPLVGYSGDQQRFIGSRIVCHLSNAQAIPIAATLLYGDGRVAATATGGTLTIMAGSEQ